MTDRKPNDRTPLQGEGDYIAAERFQREEADFARNGPVKQKAIEAEKALDGPEGAELERAREATAQGRPKGASS